jgi:8-oxo-dGTP pyrophosphatase MutT (NUDIX family)
MERSAMDKEKTGVELKGVKAINPASGEEISIWVADYVLGSYGTGAIMAVPAHDERDFEFAQKFGLPVKQVVMEQVGERKSDMYNRNGAFAILEKDEKILILRDKINTYYRLPGGKIEEGEDLISGLIREVQEETPYTNVQIGGLIAEVETNYFKADKKTGQQTDIYMHRHIQAYTARLLNDEQSELGAEDVGVYEYHWMTYEEAIAAFRKNPQDIAEGRLVEIAYAKKMGHNYCFAGQGVSINSDFLNYSTTTNSASDGKKAPAQTPIIEERNTDDGNE